VRRQGGGDAGQDMIKSRSFAQIERQTLREADPSHDRRAEWKRQFASAVEILKHQASLPPCSPKERRDGLKRLAKALKGALRKLPAECVDFHSAAEALRDRAAREADQIEVPRRGGADAADPHVHLKPLAAQYADHLLVDWGRKVPKLHRQRFVASLLLEAATGERGITVVAACERYRYLHHVRIFATAGDLSSPIFLGAPFLSTKKGRQK
jgi:hypothetical protein